MAEAAAETGRVRFEERAVPPKMKVEVKGCWNDEPQRSQYTGYLKFKMVVWVVGAVLLVAAAVGLSVYMSILHRNATSGPPSPPAPLMPPPPPLPPGVYPSPSPPPRSPPPSPDDDDDDGGHGGGGSGGGTLPDKPIPVSDTDPPFKAPDGWTAVWWDEFDGDLLNLDYWSYDKGNGDW